MRRVVGTIIDPSARVERLCEGVSGDALARAAAELTSRYREGASLEWTQLHYLAYVVARLPATSRAIAAAVTSTLASSPGLVVSTIADLGAGPGTSVFALADRFPQARYRLYERDPAFIALGRRLLDGTSAAAEYVKADVTRDALEPADLVLCSYALGELPTEGVRAVVARAWAATRRVLIVVEPGSRHGCRLVLAAREHLVGAGGVVAAPCPHGTPCPLPDDDWCHFGVRVSRGRLHRLVKQAELSYEDEKYSYVAVVKGEARPADARIIRRPEMRPRLVQLVCCTASGIERLTVSKRDPARYRLARASQWGDAWPRVVPADEDPAVGGQEVEAPDDRHGSDMSDQDGKA